MKRKSINQKLLSKTTFLVCLTFSMFFFALINTSSSLIQLNVNPNLDPINENKYSGIKAYRLESSVISRNSIIQNGLNGIFLYICSENWIESNSISYNDGNGLHIMKSENTSVNFNYFHHNKDYGVYLDYKRHWSQIDHNEFYKNNQMGKSQAYDEGEENLWYDPKTLEGNFWSDHENGDYEIDGSSNSFDKYPLSNKIDEEYTVIANFLFVPSILISLLFLLVLEIPRRSKRRS